MSVVNKKPGGLSKLMVRPNMWEVHCSTIGAGRLDLTGSSDLSYSFL